MSQRGKEVGLARWKSSAAYRSLHEPSLRPSEQVVFAAMREAGWLVLRNGWPDFLAEKDGHARFVETKGPGDRLSPEQKRIRRCLRRFGIEVEVARVQRNGDLSPSFSVDVCGIPQSQAARYKDALVAIARMTDDPIVQGIARRALKGGP